MRHYLKYSLPLIGGILTALANGKQEYLLLPWIAVSLFFIPTFWERKRLIFFLSSLAFWLVSIPWIAPTVSHYGKLPATVGIIAYILLSCYLSLYALLFAHLISYVKKTAHLVIIAPFTWVFCEYLRSIILTGFPWNLLAYSAIKTSGILQVTSFIGSFGVSLLISFCGITIAGFLTKRIKASFTFIAIVAVALILVAATLYDPVIEKTETIKVSLIQPQQTLIVNPEDPYYFYKEYQKVLSMSKEECKKGVQLVVWPEGASWPFSFFEHRFLREDIKQLTRLGCSILINTTVAEKGKNYNSVLLVTGKEIYRYDKLHLVPFGEYVPLSDLFPYIETIARESGNFSRGEKGEGIKDIAVAICYEIIFPHLVATLTTDKKLMATVTNDGWYGDSYAPYQHFRAARFRAAENGKFLLRAALTGISAIIDQKGRVVSSLGVGKIGVVRGEVELISSSTFYNRTYFLVPLLSFCVAIIPVAKEALKWFTMRLFRN